MSRTVNLGILGTGLMGTALAHAAAGTGLGRVVSALGSNSEKTTAFADEFGARLALNMDDLLADTKLDAVMVALPPSLHRESVVMAAEAGKHVFVEKPMALSVNDCDAMLRSVREAGTTLMVGHVLRYYEPFRTILRWSAEGRLGAVLHAAIWRVGDGSYTKLTPWRASRALSGGYLYEVGSHELDFLRCLIGEPVVVHASVKEHKSAGHEIEDVVSMHVDFGSGVAATYLGGTGFATSDYGFCLRFEDAVIRARAPFCTDSLAVDTAHGVMIDVSEIRFGRVDPLVEEMRSWLESILLGTQPPITGEDARKTIALVESAYRSATELDAVNTRMIDNEDR